jgi:hypothetical protein
MCGQCRQVFYCSKGHQKDHWKSHKHICNRSAVVDEKIERTVLEKALFPEAAIVVEPEEFEEEDEEELKKYMEKANVWEDAGMNFRVIVFMSADAY